MPLWSDWFSITPYSFIDLAVLVICFGLAAGFYFIYYKLGRRWVDLIFANCLACITVIALGFFTEDNTESPLVALRWARINYAMAAFFSASLLHFVFEFLKDRSRMSKIITLAAYGISVIAAAATYSGAFYQIHAQPLSPRSWANVSPGFPQVGLAQNGFTGLLLLLAGYALYKLHAALSKNLVEPRSVRRTKLLFHGVGALALFFALDYTLYALTSVCTVALSLLGFLAFCLPAAAALGEEVIHNRRLKEALSKYVSPHVTNEILTKGLLFESRECEVTVLFADIRDFTSITHELGPKGITSFLNRYLTLMTEVIFRHEGMLIQTVGDGLLAVFGAAGAGRGHELAAVRAALDMVAALEELNLTAAEGGKANLVRIGIGLHSGLVVIGNVGGEKHVDYRVTGDTVNIAARVEQYSKVVGQPLLVTATTYAKIQGVVLAKSVGEAPVKPGETSVPVLAISGLRAADPTVENRSNKEWQILDKAIAKAHPTGRDN